MDDYVEIVDGYVNKLKKATDAGHVDEAEKLKDIVRYMLLAVRIQQEQTTNHLTKLQQTLRDLDVNGNSKMVIERVQAEIRTAEDILALETKYAGFLLEPKLAIDPTAIGVNHVMQTRSPWSSAEEYVRLELVKARIEEATVTADHGAYQPNHIHNVRQRVSILEQQLSKLELVKAKNEETKLAETLTSDHPKLIQAQRRLALLEKQLSDMAVLEANKAENIRRINSESSGAKSKLRLAAERSRIEADRRLSDE